MKNLYLPAVHSRLCLKLTSRAAVTVWGYNHNVNQQLSLQSATGRDAVQERQLSGSVLQQIQRDCFVIKKSKVTLPVKHLMCQGKINTENTNVACVWKRVKSKLESSLIRLWHTRRHIRRTSIPVVIQDCKIGASVNASAAVPFSENKLQIKSDWSLHKTRSNLNTYLTAAHYKQCNQVLLYLFFGGYGGWWLYSIKLAIWSGFNLLKLACSSASYPTATRHWNPCRILMAGMWKRCGTAKDEEGSMYGGWVKKMERRWDFGNYTCETRHGAHTPLMQTAVLQEKHWSLRMFA